MKLRPGKKTISNWLFQKRLGHLGVRFGLRQALRLFGPIGMWVHCLSQSKTLKGAIKKWRALAKVRGE